MSAPKPGVVAGFPASAVGITPEWLTSQLRSTGLLSEGQRVVSVHATSISEGVGMMGQVDRITAVLDGTGSGSSISLIVKSASPSENNRSVASTFRLYEREVRFYNELAPKLGTDVPACHGSWSASDGEQFLILLEDLDGYVCGDQVAGCRSQEALPALDVLARLHSRFWQDTQRRPYPWVPSVNSPMIRDSMIGGCRATWESALDRFGHLLPTGLRAATPTFINRLPHYFEHMSSTHQTFAHTDFRLDNLMFSAQALPADRPVVALDWSSVMQSKGVHDLAFLLSQNVDVEERRANEDSLLEYYYAGLCKGGVEDYSLEQLTSDYKTAILFEFVYALLIGGVLDVSNARATSFVEALFTRCSTAIDDHDLLHQLTNDQ